jgi:hypothetical protein
MRVSGHCSRTLAMKWRIMLKLVGPDGVKMHNISGYCALGLDGIAG